MDNYFTEEDRTELLINTAKRIPICLCIDTSGSMSYKDNEGISRIERVKKGLNDFFESVSQDFELSSMAEICILGYSTKPYLVRKFKTIEEGASEDVRLVADGKGDMGLGVLEALNICNKRKEQYKEMGRDYYQPILVILSDGHTTGEGNVGENLQKAQRETLRLESEHKLVTIGVYMGPDWETDEKAQKQLYGFAKKNPPKPVECKDLPKYFEYLTRSISASVSCGLEDYEFDFEDWDNF